MEKRVVPSFSSFKPKASSTAPTTHKEGVKDDKDRSTRSTRNERKEHDRRRHKSHRSRHSSSDRKRDGDQGFDHRERKDRIHRSDRERHRELPCAKTPPSIQDESDESDVFMIDRRGDVKNVQFGGLHRYSIPPYYRAGSGGIIGADRYALIDRDASTEKAIFLRSFRSGGSNRAERLLTKKHAKSEGRNQRLVLPRAKGEEAAHIASDLKSDFLALRPSLKRKRGSDSLGAGAQDVEYRSIEGKAKPDQQPQDEDLEFESSSDEAEDVSTSDDQIRKTNARLSRATKANPTDVDAWLALMEHQAKTAFPGVDPSDLTSFQRRSIADIRLSILDQGFKHISKEYRGHDQMLLSYLTEGSHIWDSSKLSQKWQTALEECPGSLILWQAYLNFVQADQAMFSYEKVKGNYLNGLNILKTVHTEARSDNAAKVMDAIIYVLLRFARFSKDSGYDELAVAIWQAVLEYQLFVPTISHGQTKLQAFEEFWESDAPRIGEVCASGWRRWASVESSAQRKSFRRSVPKVASNRRFASFARAEKITADAFFLPAGDAGEDDKSDDPFRYVMFSDIKPVLERLPEQLDILPLVNAFLCFMCLPMIDQGRVSARDWPSDPFLVDHAGSTNLVHSSAERRDSFGLFHNAFDFEVGADASSFVYSTLSAIITALPEHEDVGEYLLAFLSRIDPPETAKAAKRLLKSRPTSIRYYNAYALAESDKQTEIDQMSKSEQIWTKALELSLSLSEVARDNAVVLWHSWMMSLIHRGDEDRALQVLFAMPDGSATALCNVNALPSSGATLRSRRHLEEGMDRMMLKRHAVHTALYADCLWWLLYLSTKHDIDAALKSFAVSSTRLQREGNQHTLELHHQAKARLIDRHMAAKRAFKPTTFRDELVESRRIFPENSMILRQYNKVARLTRLDDRLRNALKDAGQASTAPQGPMSWVFAIEAEIDRCSVEGALATKDSVRALFRRALLTPDAEVSSSPLLWKMWFDFESRILRSLPEEDTPQRLNAVRRAKQVFYDGLRFLPWHKGWIIDGMEVFAKSGDMDEGELRRIHDVLVERELRARVEVNDLMGPSA